MQLDKDLLIRYEQGDLSEEEFLTLFQQIFDTQAHKWLKGHYSQTLSQLCSAGLIHLA
jgi:hypothetical protein